MRLALVAERSCRWREGEPRERERLRLLAERLSDRGHDVQVFCTQFWEGYERRLRLRGVTYRAVTVAPARSTFGARVGPMLAGFRPAAVHARPTPAAALAGARTGATMARCPLVAEWTGHESPDAFDGRLTRQAIRAADRTLVPSGLVGTLARELGVPDGSVEQVPHAIDPALIRRTDPHDGADIVYAGRLDGPANVEDLLLALAELRTRGWTAQVIGDGPKRAAYEELAAEYRIDDRVTFTGDLPRKERVARYRDSHAFVQTRLEEPFATELLWALAAGCVGIVEYQAGSSAHELVSGTGRGVRVTTPEELSDALFEAADRPKRDYDPAFERYGWGTVVDRYLTAYGVD
jgi:glycosyltransferase involved in cell wall biosynthesis